MSFSGKVVLVSGAARGFGRLAAERLAREGARLVLCDFDGAGLSQAVAACEAAGADVAALAGDVSDDAVAKGLVELAVQRFGRLDMALNNAGIGHPMGKLPDVSLADAERVLRVNLLGVFLALKYQLPAMERQRSGSIVNVSSAAGLVGAPLMSVYAASKHGVVGLTKTAAAEFASKGIRVNAICPAFAATPMVDGLLADMGGDSAATKARLTASIPMRRIAEPAEIVEAMLWMLGPGASFMTGHAMALDGGLSAV